MKSIVKKIIPFISSIIISLIFTITINADLNFVVDDANLLSSQEETKLRIDLENFKNEYNMDAVIVTSNNLNGKSQQDYADDYFDYNGYGVGKEKKWIVITNRYGKQKYMDIYIR